MRRLVLPPQYGQYSGGSTPKYSLYSNRPKNTIILLELKEPPQMPIFLDFGKIDKSVIYLFLIRLIFEKDNADYPCDFAVCEEK